MASWRTYKRTDCSQSGSYKKMWNAAGMPRFCGRTWAATREYVLARDGFICQVPNCQYCGNVLLSGDMYEVDHVVSWARNGAAALAYTYGTPLKVNGSYAFQPVGISGRSKGLVISRTLLPGGESLLVATYGAEHAARIMHPKYSAEYDPFNLMVVCRRFNQACGSDEKPNESALVAIAVANQMAYSAVNPWNWATNRPTVEVSLLDVPTPVATMQRFASDCGRTVAQVPAAQVPAMWPVARFQPMAVYPLA